MAKEKEYPEPVVGALIINSEDKILLSQGKKWGGQYTIFGGHVELGESLEDAVKREVKEETGLDVEVVAQLRFGEDIFDKKFNRKAHFVFLDFLCRFDGDGSAVKTNEEYEDAFKWYSADEALNLDLAKGTREIIESYLKYEEERNALDGWKRCQADFENYRKMQSEERRQLSSFASENMILQLLPILDNFHASTDHIPEEQRNGAWVVGIMHIQKQLETFLKDNGVEEIETKEGDKFSPDIHEALHQEETSNKKQETNKSENTITKIVSKGYKIGGKVIRAARVIVS